MRWGGAQMLSMPRQTALLLPENMATYGNQVQLA